VHFRREQWDTPDDDFLDIDFADVVGRTWRDLGPDSPIVLLLHGLGGDARGGYSVATYRALAERGIRGVGMNYRGCGGTPNRRGRLFHAGATDDPRFVLETLTDRFPGVPIAAIGFSLGGHMLMKMAAEPEPLTDSMRGLVSVSSPLDLTVTALRLEQGMGKIYARWILRSLRVFVRAKQARGWTLSDQERANGARDPDFAAALRAKTIRAFDDALIAPLHGFRDVADYYIRASCGQDLGDVRLPLVIIRADDDPFLDPVELDLPGLHNPNIELVVTRGGGHVGFVEFGRRGPRFWSESVAADRLSAILRA
jgi:predicted alpha/beta-fold hydrolase